MLRASTIEGFVGIANDNQEAVVESSIMPLCGLAADSYIAGFTAFGSLPAALASATALALAAPAGLAHPQK